LRDAFDRFTSKVKGRFKLAMADLVGEDVSFERLRHELRAKAAPLMDVCMDVDLKPVLGALAAESDSDDQWFDQVAAVIMKKPLSSWGDSDLEPFAMHVGEIRERIRQLDDLKRIAERKRDSTSKPYIIGIATPDGGMAHKNLPTFTNLDTINATKVMEEFVEADKETRTAWLSLLIQAMIKQGDFS